MFKKQRRLNAARQLDEIELVIERPCSIEWQDMRGDERIRHCDYCNLNVYNLIGLSANEIRDLINAHEGRLCARFYARTDGTMTTEPCFTNQSIGVSSEIQLLSGIVARGAIQAEDSKLDSEQST